MTIIVIMLSMDLFGFGLSRCCLKKSVTLIPILKCFLRPPRTYPTGSLRSFRSSGVTAHGERWLVPLAPYLTPVIFSFALLYLCGLLTAQLFWWITVVLTGRIFSQCQTVKGSIMTISSDVRQIQYFSELVFELVENRKYEQAHCALDDVVRHVCHLHRKLDKKEHYDLHAGDCNGN